MTNRNLPRLLKIGLLLCVGLVVLAPAASAQGVSATAEVTRVVQNGQLLDVEFSITLTNGESSVASNAFVVFEDQLQVSLGDVAAGGSATTAKQTRAIDRSEIPTSNFPLRATLMFSLDGADVELPVTLRLKLDGEGGQ